MVIYREKVIQDLRNGIEKVDGPDSNLSMEPKYSTQEEFMKYRIFSFWETKEPI